MATGTIGIATAGETATEIVTEIAMVAAMRTAPDRMAVTTAAHATAATAAGAAMTAAAAMITAADGTMPDALPPEESITVRFDGVAAPVVLHRCTALVRWLAPLVDGWPRTEEPGETGENPAITVSDTPDGYQLSSRWMDKPERYRDRADIVCAFLAELMLAWGKHQDNMICLHAGAVALDGRLLVFPAAGRVGKSTLTTHLAAQGGRVWSDDVVPVDPDSGLAMALGVAPRLRRPLPKALSPAFHDYAGRCAALGNDSFGYVRPGRGGEAGSLARHGETLPVAAFVLPVREPGGDLSLAETPRAELMQILLNQHFAAPWPMDELVSRLGALVNRLPCYRLAYDNAADAASMMAELARALPAAEPAA